MEKIRVAGIGRESLIDGPGIRLVLFAQGCLQGCRGCHNPGAQDLSGGREMTSKEIMEMIRSSPGIDGVTFSGGEPFLQAGPLSRLGKEIRELGLNIVIYSGYTFEELWEISRTDDDYRRLLEVSDILIDGRYVQEERDLSIPFRGSRNQRILDAPASMRKGAPVDYR